MAFTQAQIDSLRGAIATGTKIVRNGNGEYIEYRSLAEMRQTLAVMEAASASLLTPRVTGIYPAYSRFPAASDDGDAPLSQP